jgi:subtilisin family serine protease
MKRAILLVTVMVMAAVVACSGVALAQQDRTTSDTSRSTPPRTPTAKIENTYIVVFEEGAVDDPAAKASEHARANGLQLRFVYRHAIEGYAAVFPNEQARDRVSRDQDVDYIEQDGVVHAVVDPQPLPWGIDKVEADKSSMIAGDGSGTIRNVNAYIIDSGIGNHSDLYKVNHVNFAGGKNDDCSGHGTHVAGTVAAKDNTSDVVGVGEGAPLTGVKVLGCSGSGSWSGVIKGVDWVTANAKKPAVANMSLGGGANQSVDDAVKKSADSGVFYAIAAGNDGADACKNSPARAGTHNGVMTVAATDSNDKEASWSNYGSCVDIWAPGVSILSTKMRGGTTTMSGTSMASPHGAGGGALYLEKLYLESNTTASPATVEDALKSNATTTANKSKDGRTITRENVDPF